MKAPPPFTPFSFCSPRSKACLVCEGSVVLQTVCLVADEQVAGIGSLEPAGVEAEGLVRDNEDLGVTRGIGVERRLSAHSKTTQPSIRGEREEGTVGEYKEETMREEGRITGGKSSETSDARDEANEHSSKIE